MLFNSFQFIVFFIVVTGAYFSMPHKFRWFWLLAASCYFYMAFVPYYILILALTITVDYFAAIQIEKSEGRRKKLFLNFSIISTCAILFVFKYFNFFNDNFAALAGFLHWNYPIGALRLILPIGLSFHTFQSLSYVIEVYRGKQKAEHNFGIYSLYVMFYPQLVAGPIERPQNLLHQFREKHSFDYDRIKSGLLLMLWGMFKKVVIADTLCIYVNAVYNHHTLYHGWAVLFATYFFAFQIYCDFSGYSNIAIGAARVMGFKLMTNFNMPYFSRSVGEFWRRWHISLSTWFKDYLYIPLGGNRVSKWRKYLNLMITFLVSGLWHGANWTFVIWGGLNGGYHVVESETETPRRKFRMAIGLEKLKGLNSFLQIFITFNLICIAWIFFRANSLKDSLQIISSIPSYSPLRSMKINSIRDSEFYLSVIYIIGLIAFEKIVSRRHTHVDSYIESRPLLVRWSIYVALLTAIFILGNFGFVEFIYFQF